MQFFYRYISPCIALLGAIFFPYMPVVHAHPVEIPDHTGCSGMHREKDTEQHSMLLCIQAVHDTSIGHIIVQLGDTIHTIVPIWQRETYNEVSMSWEVTQLFHALDPPFFGGKDLVGIVKLTT